MGDPRYQLSETFTNNGTNQFCNVARNQYLVTVPSSKKKGPIKFPARHSTENVFEPWLILFTFPLV